MKTSQQSATALILTASPRSGGNSTILAEQIGKGLESAGIKVETVRLHGKNIQPCRGCDYCQGAGSPGCVIKDDMQALYPVIKESAIIVYATPIYWFTVSAQLKLFMDRCYALATPEVNFLEGKRMAVALAYGDTDPFTSGCVNALRTFQDSFRYLDADFVGSVYGSASDAGEITENAEAMKKAFELGKALAAS